MGIPERDILQAENPPSIVGDSLSTTVLILELQMTAMSLAFACRTALAIAAWPIRKSWCSTDVAVDESPRDDIVTLEFRT